MITAILAELDGVISLDDVVLLVATGTHRGNTDAEIRTMLGDDIVGSVRVVNHDARDPGSLTWCGTFGNGVPVWLNRLWVQADVEESYVDQIAFGQKLRIRLPSGVRNSCGR